MKHQSVVASHAPPSGDLAHNPGMCRRLGIKLATLWSAGWHSVHSATPARAGYYILFHMPWKKLTQLLLFFFIITLSTASVFFPPFS